MKSGGAATSHRLFGLAVLTLLVACARAPAPVQPSVAGRGNLVLIGGGAKPDDVIQLFVDLAGGASARIVVLPLASEEPREAGEEIARIMGEHGVRDVSVIQIDDRRDAWRHDYARAVRSATGVFFGGGDQRRIAARIVDTPILDALREVKARGGVIGGTSAGIACQSAVMLTGDGDESSLAPHNIATARGLGLFEGVVVDSHFVVRRRFKRLQSVVLEHPELLGIGVDEATATWVKPDGTMEIRGRGEVIVYDASTAAITVRGGMFEASGMKTHALTARQRFDLRTRRVLQ